MIRFEETEAVLRVRSMPVWAWAFCAGFTALGLAVTLAAARRTAAWGACGAVAAAFLLFGLLMLRLVGVVDTALLDRGRNEVVVRHASPFGSRVERAELSRVGHVGVTAEAGQRSNGRTVRLEFLKPGTRPEDDELEGGLTFNEVQLSPEDAEAVKSRVEAFLKLPR